MKNKKRSTKAIVQEETTTTVVVQEEQSDILKDIDTDKDGKIEIKEAAQYVLHSKTVWINVVSLLAFHVQNKYGFVIDPATQMEILSGINVMLRMFTNKPLTYTKTKE
jgi:hypothetical protein